MDFNLFKTTNKLEKNNLNISFFFLKGNSTFQANKEYIIFKGIIYLFGRQSCRYLLFADLLLKGLQQPQLGKGKVRILEPHPSAEA